MNILALLNCFPLFSIDFPQNWFSCLRQENCIFRERKKHVCYVNSRMWCLSRLAARFEYRFRFINFNYIFNFSHPKLEVILNISGHKFRSEWQYLWTYLDGEESLLACVLLFNWAKSSILCKLVVYICLCWQKAGKFISVEAHNSSHCWNE